MYTCYTGFTRLAQNKISLLIKIHVLSKKMKSEFPLNIHNMHIMSTIKEHEILLSGFRGVALTICYSSICNFAQISKFKSGIIPRKNILKFLQICVSTQYVLHSNNVSRNSDVRLQMCCANKKKKAGLLTN